MSVVIEHLSHPFEESDLNNINELNLEAFDTKGNCSFDSFFDFLLQRNTVCVIARDVETRRIVGKATIFIFKLDDGRKKGFIENVAVLVKYQGSGIADQIDDELYVIAQENECEFIDLTSSPNKKRANRFYQKRRYKLRRTNYYRKLIKPRLES